MGSRLETIVCSISNNSKLSPAGKRSGTSKKTEGRSRKSALGLRSEKLSPDDLVSLEDLLVKEYQWQEKQQETTEAVHQLQQTLKTRLQCSATIIGVITHDPMPIEVQGMDELEFEELHAEYKKETTSLEKALLEKWATYPWHRRKLSFDLSGDESVERGEYVAISKTGVPTTLRASSSGRKPPNLAMQHLRGNLISLCGRYSNHCHKRSRL
jgi:hypothetical protein